MNHVYRLVRNAAGQARPIPECGRGRGKGGTKPALALAAALALPAFAQNTLPTGATVAAGQASVANHGAQMTVTQSSDKAILNWQRFDIGSQAAVRFVQPSASSVALNRVLAGEASQIHGQLSANGQVYLVNPAGIVFGPGSRVDVGGLVASVMDIADADFLAGRNVFRRNGATGAIVNQGEITAAEGGLVALLAPTVRNEGIVRAQLGNVALAAGDQVTLHAGADGHLQLAIAPATLQTLVENRQLIVADGGQVLMTSRAADALSSGVVANSGTVQARTLQHKEGRILLLADMAHGEVRHSGLLDASAPAAGNGGFVETSAATVTLVPGRKVTTAATQGATGTWLIDPNDYTIAASGGNISGAQLSADLASSNVTIATASQGTAGGNGDIFVNDAVGWSANTLTLNAERHIAINAVMTASGTAGLAMNYGGTHGNPAATPATGSMLMTGLAPGVATGFTGRVDFPGRSGTGFLAINGNSYHVLGAGDLGVAGDASTTTLQGMRNNLAGFYALGADIDASATAGWNAGAGFTPVGTSGASFTGSFDGLGHVVSGLGIHSGSSWIGLFGRVDDATLRNVGLAQGAVRGSSYIGPLAGQVASSTGKTTIHNVYASTAVQGSYAGGLLGQVTTTGSGGAFTLAHAQTSGVVTGGNFVGGLVGSLELGGTATLWDVHTTGQVSGLFGAGLVGFTNLAVGASLRVQDASTAGDISGLTGLGGLMGYVFLNAGAALQLDDVHTTGHVTASPSSSNGVGGLIGMQGASSQTTVTITDASASGSISGLNAVGGLIGSSSFGSSDSTLTVLRAQATGPVTGASGSGGLVGSLSLTGSGTVASFDTVHAGGQVSGTNNVGGLIGYMLSGPGTVRIDRADASGDVTASADGAGGLLGAVNLQPAGRLDIADSHATGDVSTATFQAGGLVGTVTASSGTAATVTRSYATGQVSGGNDIGGLLGHVSLNGTATLDLGVAFAAGDVTATGLWSGGLLGRAALYNAAGGHLDIADTYAIGNVAGNDRVGGLVGALDGAPAGGTYGVRSSYAAGAVTGNGNVGGLVGSADAGTSVATSFWDLQRSGQASSAGGVGMATAALRTLANFDSATAANGNADPGWEISTDPAAATVWRHFEGLAYPVLRPLQPQLSGTVNDAAKTYDGLAYTGGNGVTAAPGSVLPAGTVVYTGSSQGATNAGQHVLSARFDPGFASGATQLDYQWSPNVVLQAGSLTVTPAALTVTAADATKVYGQTPALDGSAFTAIGLQNGETIASVVRASSGSAANAAVGAHAITASGAAGGSFNAGNYTITYLDGTLTVTPAALTITANDASKVYGQAAALGNTAFSASGLQNGETVASVALASSGAAATAGVGSHAIVAGSASGGSFSAGNYTITYLDGTLTVTPAALTITANDASKVYGQVATLGSTAFTASGLQNGETVASVVLGSSGGAASAGVGRYAVTAGSAGGTFSAGNYTIRYQHGTLTVTPAPLTVTAADASKAEGQTLVFAGTEFTASGLQNGETIASVALASSGAAAAAGAGSHTITAGNAAGGTFDAGNYTITYRNGRLTVTAQPVTQEQTLPPKPYIVEEMERSVLAQDLARSRAVATAAPQSTIAATGASGVPFLTLAPTLVRVED
jgi:filamentous hemagglutinin family protein